MTRIARLLSVIFALVILSSAQSFAAPVTVGGPTDLFGTASSTGIGIFDPGPVVFTFTGVPQSDGTDGTLTVHAIGDFDEALSALENLTVTINGSNVSLSTPTLPTTELNPPLNTDVEFTEAVTITGTGGATALDAMTGTGTLTLSFTPSATVTEFSTANTIDVTITYNSVDGPPGIIPEPSAFVLGLLALLPLILGSRRIRRRRN